MPTRTLHCACGCVMTTTAPPVVDEVPLCYRCAHPSRLSGVRPVTVCAPSAPSRPVAAPGRVLVV